MSIPYEIIIEITKYIPFYLNKNILSTNKYFFRYYKKKYLKNVIYIQKTYRKYRLPSYFLSTNTFLMYTSYHNWQRIFNKNNKIKIYRYLILKKMNFLRGYPEFLLNKSCVINSSRYLIINDWIINNLPVSVMVRTRKNIFTFFKYNRITLREITNTGF
jgi:hypothetical protein